MSDITLKVSEKTFGEVFNKLWPALNLPFSGDGSWAGLWDAVDGQFHIVGAGEVEFNDSNSFTASEIDLNWDKLILKVGIDIPEIKIGKFCLLETPNFLTPWFGEGCMVRACRDEGEARSKQQGCSDGSEEGCLAYCGVVWGLDF